MTGRQTVRRLDEIPAEAGAVPGVEVRRLKRVEKVELKALDLAAGQAAPFHEYPHAHEGVILAGTLLRDNAAARVRHASARSRAWRNHHTRLTTTNT